MTGVAAALLFFALGLVTEGAIVPRFKHPRETPPAAAPAKPPQPPQPPSANADDFTVATSEVIVAEDSWTDPFLIPATLGVLIVTSALTYRRLRKAPTSR